MTDADRAWAAAWVAEHGTVEEQHARAWEACEAVRKANSTPEQEAHHQWCRTATDAEWAARAVEHERVTGKTWHKAWGG